MAKPTPCGKAKDGWWTAEVESAGPGSDYGFVLDGEGPFPDPRSPWQPNGVHALSRVVDHDGFPWTDAGFRAPPLSAAVIYELHIGTFTPERHVRGGDREARPPGRSSASRTSS